MANIDAVKEWEQDAIETFPEESVIKHVPMLIRMALEAYHKPTEKPKPEPKPLKLEAGARVHMQDQAGVCLLGSADLLHVDNDKALIIDSNGYRHLVRLEDLTVIEAATPGVGDYVQIIGETYATGGAGHIGGEVDSHAYRISGTLGHSEFSSIFDRRDFTILHKAPKEG